VLVGRNTYEVPARGMWGILNKQMNTEMVISSHFVKSNKASATNPSPHYHQFGSQHTNESDKRKQKREMRKKAWTTTSQDVGSGEVCTIYKDGSSTEEEDNNTESNKAKDKIVNSVITGVE
jgi:hypothetical protein